MKKILLMIPLCLIGGIIQAQTIIEKQFDFSRKESISLNIQIADSIKVIPWDKNEVSFRASVNVNDNKDNEHYKWTFDDSGKEVKITSKFDDYINKSSSSRNCCCMDTRIYCEIHIPASARLSVETINGDGESQGAPR
jgi:hypothetical protein